MAYITRTNAEALIETQVAKEITEGVIAESVVLKHAKRLPNMTSGQTRLPVLDSLPVAGFTGTDAGLKPTSTLSWKGVEINAGEIAVIVPISENTLADAKYDIWGAVKPRAIEAIGKVLDAAVLYGTNKPSNWANGLITQITSAGNNVAYSATDNLYKNIDDAMSKVEEDGFVPNVLIGGVNLKSGFRNMLDTTGQPITGTEIDSINKIFVENGAWDNTIAKFVVGDFNNLVFAVRDDISYKVLDQSVISDSDGKVLLNLAQQDMVALRITFRCGWAVPNPVTALNGDEDTRFPFASVDAQ